MFIALVIAAVLLAAMCASSASQKLRKHERSVAIIGGTVGVPVRYFPVLASLELAGAAGILLGLWLEPLGVAVAAAHPRVRDTKGLIMPLLPLVFSIAVLALRLATL